MPQRAFTDNDRSLAENLLNKARRTASEKEDGNLLYDPQAFEPMRPTLGHKTLTLAFMRAQLVSLDQLQKALIDLIKHRLHAQNVHFPSLNVKTMSWCIPRE
jgi:hypothetical protein